jgi:hypothetical protein
MDSNKIKNLAFGARDALRAEVAARIDSVLESGSSERLDLPEKVRRLEATIDDKGMDAVVESTAYTWFNRLCALRFMDAKGYTPVPVVTPRPGATQPAILADAAQGVFDPDFGFSRLVRDRVQSVLAGGSGSGANRTEAAYGELLVAVCDHYAQAMPYLFGEAVASSLVMPQGLLAEGSILRRIVEDMDDEECETVEVLGWLYQFYVAERKAEFNNKEDQKAAAEDIAPATQLFTPDWIVKYLVENSLGRLWMLNNPNSALAEKMDYYIAPEGETEDFIRVYSPEELTLCDPACGSGHILVYAFDLLFEIYQEEAYFPEDIPALILQNNLFGMEIDGRAAEIAKFALEMKAREKDPGFFEKKIDANVTVLEPVAFEPGALDGVGPIAGATELLDAFEHMTEVGSLYVPAPGDMAAVDNAIASFSEDDLIGTGMLKRLHAMKSVLEALSRRVDCVVANPPYLGSSHFNDYMKDWIRGRYPDEKSDLCTCFIKRGFSLAKPNGYSSMVTMHSWMFIDSYKAMRTYILNNKSICSMAHLGTRAFEQIGGEVVQVAATVFLNGSSLANGVYFRLVDETSSKAKADRLASLVRDEAAIGRHCTNRDAFRAIPGCVIAYWCSETMLDTFRMGEKLSSYGTFTKGVVTGDNLKFLRAWWEPSYNKIGLAINDADQAVASGKKWFPCNKGGAFRRWRGNNEYVINWEDEGHDIFLTENAVKHHPQTYKRELQFKTAISWSSIATDAASFRMKSCDLAEAAGMSLYLSGNTGNYLLALLNSSVCGEYLKVLAPTLNIKIYSLEGMPVLGMSRGGEVEDISNTNMDISSADWNSFETSWDFEWHPLAPSARERAEQLSYGMNSDARTASVSLISERFKHWSAECDERFNQLKSNEEQLNRIFARIYGMEGEVPIEVPDDKVSVRRADLVRDVKSLVSYGVGCIMGRYSTFAPGLILADAQQTVDDFKAKVPNAEFLPDEDAILPVLDGEWFGDDIVAQFRKWLEVTYGAEALDENIRFIEDALGKDLRKYFVKDFYKDHCATYQVTGSGKRPIYWMFASPKGSFQVLVYMHRYTPSTVGQILTKYLREYIEKINAKIGQLDQSDRAADNRQSDKYRAAVHELTDWERTVIYPLANERVDIDLDDGVRKNYNKFPRALARVAGLSEWK